jgi:hypothetical protein
LFKVQLVGLTSLCAGAFLLSDTNMTDEGGIYSSGGALSFWNILLSLIKKYADREPAGALRLA